MSYEIRSMKRNGGTALRPTPEVRTLALALLVTAGVLAIATACAAAPAASADSLATAPDPEQPIGSIELDREMVLIHGLGGAASEWDDLAPFLKATFRVYQFELSGHGHTQPILDPTIAKEAERLADFLAENGVQYPTLVGHGMGGLIALRYSLDHPAAVDRLILLDAAPMQLATTEQKAETAKALASDYDRFVANQYLQMSMNREVGEVILDLALKTDSASFISLLLSSFDFDMSEELRTLSVPMLVIGSEMLFPDPSTCREVLYKIGFGKAYSLNFKRMDRTGHYMMLERPIQLASVLMNFALTADHVFEPGH